MSSREEFCKVSLMKNYFPFMKKSKWAYLDGLLILYNKIFNPTTHDNKAYAWKTDKAARLVSPFGMYY